MSAVAVLVHHGRTEATAIARRIIDAIAPRHTLRLPRKDAELVGRPDLGVDEAMVGPDAELAVSIGGDGTMLKTIELVAPHGVPVVGINAGRLGYLTEFEPDDAVTAVDTALNGEAVVDERMMLDVAIEGGGDADRWIALNEVVVEKAGQGHTVLLAVDFDGARFTSYAADALIVATPTGSTAYSLSARGAIVAPTHRSLQLTPVAPHMLFDRPLVLDPATVVRLEVLGDRDVTVSVDGRPEATLSRGQAVVATESPVRARLVTSGQRRFHDILKAKFGLVDR